MKKNEIAKLILGGLAIAGGVIVLASLPGLAAAFVPFMKKGKTISHQQFRRSFDKLGNNGFVGLSKEGDKTVIRLTKAGKTKVLKYKFEELSIKNQVKWDKKWRIVIFDIPERFKRNRDALAAKLRELGFVPVQRSVWIYPYPCEDEIDFISEIFEVHQFVRLITADKIDKQRDLLKAFNVAQ